MFFSERDFACDFIGEEFLFLSRDENGWHFYLICLQMSEWKRFLFPPLFNFLNLELLIRFETCSNIVPSWWLFSNRF